MERLSITVSGLTLGRILNKTLAPFGSLKDDYVHRKVEGFMYPVPEGEERVIDTIADAVSAVRETVDRFMEGDKTTIPPIVLARTNYEMIIVTPGGVTISVTANTVTVLFGRHSSCLSAEIIDNFSGCEYSTY